MLGLSAIGGAAIGSTAKTGATLQPHYRARASQLAMLAVTREMVPPYNSQLAYVIPSLDIAVPSAGAQMAQLAIVSVGLEYDMKPQIHGFAMKPLWGFPLMIQKGV